MSTIERAVGPAPSRGRSHRDLAKLMELPTEQREVEPLSTPRLMSRRALAGAVRRPITGQSVVEFAIVLPILLLLLMVTIDFGRIYLGWVNLQNMARIAAEYAADHPTNWNTATYQNLVKNDAKATNCDLPSAVPSPTFTSTTVGGTVRIDLTCTFHVVTPLISNVLGSGVAVSASSVFPVKTSIVPAAGGCPLPTAVSSATPLFGPLSQIFVLDASGSSPVPLAYSWDFGDGTGATGVSASHTYTTMGGYSVRLTVTNFCGSKASTKTVLVADPTFCIVPDFIDGSTSDAPTLWSSRNFTGDITYAQGGRPWIVRSQSVAANQPLLCTSGIRLGKN